MEKGPKGGPYRGAPDEALVAKMRKANEEREAIDFILRKFREAQDRLEDLYEYISYRDDEYVQIVDAGHSEAVFELFRALTLLKTATLVQQFGQETPAGKANVDAYNKYAGNEFPPYEIAELALQELTPDDIQMLKRWPKVAPPVKK